MKARRFVLVYQAGIANVFTVDSFNLSDYCRDAVRVFQGDFRTAEAMLHGMWLAGGEVMIAHCNRTGDIAREHWDGTDTLDGAPFRDSMRPPVAYAAKF